jgi:hypothetical protein
MVMFNGPNRIVLLGESRLYVALGVSEYGKRVGAVMMFEHRLIIVEQGERSARVDLIQVVETYTASRGQTHRTST